MVTSRNDFPTGAGLASSASAYAALVTAAAAALGLPADASGVSDAARIGSGSAPRSLHGGFVMLRAAADGTHCEQLAAASEWPLAVIVAITDEAAKNVTSRDGMERSRTTSPYYNAWLESHPGDLSGAEVAVRERDFQKLAELSEHSCLKMHSVMLTTQPALFYWTPATTACMRAVYELRADGVPAFFTIDAGPQVKVVCLPEARERVAAALAAVPGVLRLIDSGLGAGARLLDDDD